MTVSAAVKKYYKAVLSSRMTTEMALLDTSYLDQGLGKTGNFCTPLIGPLGGVTWFCNLSPLSSDCLQEGRGDRGWAKDATSWGMTTEEGVQRWNYMARLASEARRRQNIHIPRFQFMWPLGRLLRLDAWDFHLGGYEVGRVLHFEVNLGHSAIHGGGLVQAKVGLHWETYRGQERATVGV